MSTGGRSTLTATALKGAVLFSKRRTLLAHALSLASLPAAIGTGLATTYWENELEAHVENPRRPPQFRREGKLYETSYSRSSETWVRWPG